MCNNEFKASGSSWRRQVSQAAWESARQEEHRLGSISLDGGFFYRWEHVKAVVRTAIRLAELTGADVEVVEAAAWLHDIAKKEETEDHGREGSRAARRILQNSLFPTQKIEAVVDAIAKHVGLWSTKPVQPLEAAIVWDADKLTKLGATAVIHFAGYEVTRHQADTERILNRMAEPRWQEATVASLNTAPARTAGRARLQKYRAFCRQALLEFDAEDITNTGEDLEEDHSL